MVFSSLEFLFVFLPAFLLAQAYLPYPNLVIVAFSLLFYFVGEGWYSLIVVASVIINYGFGLLIEAQADVRRRRLAVGAGVLINLMSLTFFKYSSFLAESVGSDRAAVWLRTWHLPLGISFFTFHAISYLVDVFRRDAKAERSFVNLSLYMLMFPQLIAGPILRFHTIARQLKRRVVRTRHLHFGLLLLSLGLAQKVLLADTLAQLADFLFARSGELSTGAAWLAVIAYTFQIFFDFAGYSNMAIGLGWMMGFDFPRNFDYPYISQSVTEFWRRWHMTLSRWFRDYLYIPLGGNRGSAARTYRNLLTVFLLCGLWHGASWTFVAWGAYHGVWLVFERLGGERVLQALPRVVRHVYALLVVVVGWTLFRADSIEQAGTLLAKMFGLAPSAAGALGGTSLAEVMSNGQLVALVLAAAFSAPALPRLLGRFVQTASERPLPKLLAPRAYIPGLVLGVTMLTAVTTRILTGAYSPFIYFRF
jgi:alginate O-acetyltransferase complex protein AlgI